MDSNDTLHALAPADCNAPAQVRDGLGRSIKRVVNGQSIDRDQTVRFDFEFQDGSREAFHASCQDLPKIVGDLRGFASAAERSRRSGASKPVEMVNPYQATGARAERVGSMIVIRFPTADGIPLLVALEDSTCGILQREIEHALARPPRRV